MTDDISCPRDKCILFPVSKFDSVGKLDEQGNSINLSKYNKREFNEMLKLLGDDLSKNNKFESDTKRSFLPFYREITCNLIRKVAKWTKQPNMQELRPALLAGAWNDKCAGDREILEILSGMNCDDYIGALRKWTDIEDAPILVMSNNYHTVNIHDMWNYLYSKITSNDVENIKNYLSVVFNQIDPTFEFPEEQWYMANVLGKKLEYSQSLMHGLIITMVMLR